MKTAVRIDAPTVMLVGLDDHIGGICFAYFDDGGMRIIAVRTAAAACAQLSRVMPSLVVAQGEIQPADVAALDEHTTAVGADIIAIERGASEASIKQRLTSALQRLGQRKRETARA